MESPYMIISIQDLLITWNPGLLVVNLGTYGIQDFYIKSDRASLYNDFYIKSDIFSLCNDFYIQSDRVSLYNHF